MLSHLDPYVRSLGRHVAETVPQLERPLRIARGQYAHAYVTASAARFNADHVAGIDPYEVVSVDPARIEYVSGSIRRARFRRIGLVEDGDWDLRDRRFEDTDVYRAFVARFEEDRPWSETEFFDRVLREIDHGLEPWGCRSRADLESRCRDLDSLYESIRENGFLTQRELMDDGVDDPVGSRRLARPSRLINDEIAVDVARDGGLLFADGRNRLAIAKVLDVDEIPVLILRRHERWQAFRDEVARRARETGSTPPIAWTHPDLRGLGREE